jgi:hypothetical protein
MTIYVQGQFEQPDKALASCDYFVSTAQKAIVQDEKFIPWGDLMKIVNGMQVWVHYESTGILCQGVGGGEYACDDDVHTIETNSSMAELPHEMLHSFERLHGLVNTGHTNWDTNGAPAGAKLESGMAGPFPKGVLVGSWWDESFRWQWDQQRVWINTACPKAGSC